MAGSRPEISLCMIVRDEAECLPRCLESVQGVADEIVVVDTGSVDDTVEIARRSGARVEHFPWNGDFASARNRSLDLATGEWILVLDADEELHPDDRHGIRSLVRRTGAEGFLVRIVNRLDSAVPWAEETSVNVRLFRNRPEYRFTGILHEQIAENIVRARPGARLEPCALRILHYGYQQEVVARKEKRLRNLALAREAVTRAPEDAFLRFNLGVEYLRLERYEDALAELEAAWRLHARGALWASKLVKSLLVCLLRLGRHQDVLARAEASQAEFPDFTDLVFLRGVALFELKRHAEAVGVFHQCLAMGPAPCPPYSGVEPALGGCKAHLALGMVYEAMGRLPDAVRHYHQAVVLGGGWHEPLGRLAALLIPREDLAAVRGYLEPFFDLGQPSQRVALANLFFTHGRYDVALQYLEPPDPEDGGAGGAAGLLRGRCLAKLGQYEEALAAFRSVPPESPLHREALVHTAFCYWCLDRPRAARAAVRKLGGRDEDYLAVARLFYSEAEEILSEGLRRFPESTLLQETLVALREEIAGLERPARPASGDD